MYTVGLRREDRVLDGDYATDDVGGPSTLRTVLLPWLVVEAAVPGPAQRRILGLDHACGPADYRLLRHLIKHDQLVKSATDETAAEAVLSIPGNCFVS